MKARNRGDAVPVDNRDGAVSGASAGELLRADADEAELAVPGILAVVEERQEELERRRAQGLLARPRLAAGSRARVEDGQIRGMVSALVRGRVWYLSMFFVLPGDQGRGVGRALLERALAYGEARGVEVRCVWASLDPRAQARYVMAGMAPRWPIYRLEGDAAAVARLRARVGLDARERELPWVA